MAFRAVRSWTLVGLIMAFVDLAIACSLLCLSACAFVPSKFLSFFGLYLPCPCSGFFGYRTDYFCWHKLFVDWPIRKINAVQELVKDRFPFNLIWFGHQSSNFHVEGIDRKSKYDAKEKKIMNQKHKSGIRWRRRAAVGCGKLSPALSSNGTHLVGRGVLRPLYNCSVRSEISESLDISSGIEHGFLGDGDDSNGNDLSERTRHRFELDGSYGKDEGIKQDQFVEKFTCDAEVGAGNDANDILALEQALEEEKAMHAALYQELEKERAAAATAADEAMAMISRLQEDKASIEMEAKQYQRVIEEKIDYDEEEMNILKEILVRREKEIYFLKKEVEAYEQMNFTGNDQLEGDSSYNTEQTLSLSIDSSENPLPVLQQIDESNGGKEVAADGNQAGCNMHSSLLDTESTVYDVHVIDDKTVHGKENDGKESRPPLLGSIDLQRHPLSVIDGERLKIDNEVEWLRERLRIVQEEKEKLNFCGEHRERENAQLRLVEDIVNQLLRQASLPPSSSKLGC
ncbi:uncharacterized protein LOC110627427 isoform X1 [Manihot esculenta]|uniref:Uncharacterized protein n=1 Tax=Manihot esculenta TaxID=3983 RepID=A0ACB7GPU6_MANES|nr:uncharacterized protein LOC110627427 isoform X1 [Manihot esculenta]KAG8641934.1 hypothetical protein MANES_12G045100v8 [Manihot esculenta]